MSFIFSDYKDASSQDFKFIFKNNGFFYPGSTDENAKVDPEYVELKDALSHPDAPVFFTNTVETLIREAVEPLAIMTNLLPRINYKNGVQMTIGSVGAMYAADIAEGGEYPERTLNYGPGAKIATIGKSGLAFKITEEVKRYSQYDVIGLHLKKAGEALIRHKESKIFSMFSGLGVPTHDNVNPNSSVFGITSGRSLSGAGNGTITVENIFEAYGQLMMNGFIPDAIMMHPLAFVTFMIDPVLRTFAMQNGGGSWFNGPAGLLNKDPWGAAFSGRGPNGGTKGQHPLSILGSAPALNEYNMNITQGANIPNYLGLPLRVIVSPFIPYNVQTKLTDIYLVDTKNSGVLIVDEEPTVDEIPDKLRDITKIKIRERYAVAPLNDGQAIGVMKNVKAAYNEIILPTMANGPSVISLSRGSAVLSNQGVLIDGNGVPVVPEDPVAP